MWTAAPVRTRRLEAARGLAGAAPAVFSSPSPRPSSPARAARSGPRARARASAEPPRVVARIPTGRSSRPCAEVAGFGAVWITTFGTGQVLRINPRTNRVTGRVRVGFRPCGLAVGAGSVWVNGFGTNSVDRINPRRLRRTRSITVGNQPFDVLFAAASVWTTNSADGTVVRINPATNRIVARITTGGAPAGLSFAGGGVWVGSVTGENVFRIDPATNAVQTIAVGHPSPAWFAATDDDVWVSNVQDGTVTRLDARTGAVGVTVSVGRGPSDGVVGPDGLVWVPNLRDNTISRIDPVTNAVADTIPSGPGPFVLNTGFGDVWAASWGGANVWRLRPAPRVAAAAPRPRRFRVDVGGYRLYADCRGRGSPTVVFDAGLNGTGGSWSLIHPAVASRTRACTYDRAGLGGSDPRPGDSPATNATIAEELHALLTRGRIPGPYVLVGHSLGGVDIRLFAARHPADTAGLVFVDGSDPDLLAGRGVVLDGDEPIDLRPAAEELRGVGLGATPTMVLFANPRTDLASALARRSTNSSLVFVPRTGHYIHQERPRLVAEAVRQVVFAARTGSPLPACRATSLPRLGGRCLEAERAR